MLLQSVEIQGFKSFAEKTVLRFGRGITGVVGPNGSGKSNISDAVRWVLGEQSNRNLRGQNMEDVLFGGTAERRPCGFAEVTLTIDNSDRALNFDGDSVAVTRRFYRSHESEYLINKAAVRLKDVRELFMDTGLGRDGYSLIGQGKIDSIVSGRSEERRDIFEEAAGISRYRYRKSEAEHRLQAAEENLTRLNDILSELRARVEPLREESRKAETFLRLSEERKKLEVGLWLSTLAQWNDTLRAQESKISVAEARYAEVQSELTDLAGKIDERAARFSVLTEQIDACAKQSEQTKEEIAKIGGEIAVLQNSLAHNAEQIRQADGNRAALRQSDADTERALAEYRSEEQRKLAAANDLRAQTAALAETIAGLAGDEDALSQTVRVLTEQTDALDQSASAQRLRLATVQAAEAETEARKAAILAELDAAGRETERLASERGALESDLSAADTAAGERANALRGCELLCRNKAEKAALCKQAADGAALDIGAKKRRAAILEDLEKNMEGFSGAVKSVVRAAKNGELRGIHGTVSQILTVPEAYAVAVEVALGAAAQDIVTGTDGDAKRAIAYLKQGHLGRATFLPVESVRPRTVRAERLSACPGYIGVAASLVSHDAAYAPVAGFLLGGTVVAEDLDSAVGIAKQSGYSCKVVTLDGQVVNPGGSLTGGSLQKNAGFFSRAADLKKLREELDALAVELREKQAALASANEELAGAQAQSAAANAALVAANEDRVRVDAELRRVDGLAAEVARRVKKLEAERDGADARARALENDRAAAESALETARAKAGQLRRELTDALSGREDNARAREEHAARLNELRLQTVEAEKDAEAAVLKRRMLEDTVRDRAAKAEAYGRQIELLEKEAAELEERRARSEARRGALAKQAEEIRRRGDALTADRDGFDTVSRTLREREREKAAEREKLGGELARLNERKEAMTREYDDTVRRMFDEYGLTRSEAEAFCDRVENVPEAKRRLAGIKNAIRALGNVNVSAVEEYKTVSERYEFLTAQVEDTEHARAELKGIIGDLTEQMRTRFAEGFRRVGENFSETFTALFGGGRAELTLTDPEHILESGIDISAKLPGKNVPNLDGLSGGEKALVAIAVYFAVMRVNPPPFCFLDEVDTALDDVNVERFADYMKHSGLPTQFICITHRRGTMEAADVLYGVTMQEKGVSKLLQLNLDELTKTLRLA